MSKYLEKLNPQQLQSVLTTEGPLRVIAGAGTGKTRALTSRFCYLVSDLGIAPKNILCVTFTNRAANEMKRRVRTLLGDQDLGYICTFHAFCVQLLKEDIHTLNFPKNFVILDVEDQKQLLLKIFEDMKLTLRETTIKRIIDQVLEAKKLFATSYIDHIYQLDNQQLKAKFAQAENQDEEIFLRYLYEQKKCFGLDFNDLINYATYILDNFPQIREKWSDRMQYVMVDEFQDVSKRQYKIAQILSEKHGNLFIVGDPDQTIYTWRGSHMKLFLDFDKLYPQAKTITLSTNYRSTPEILNASNNLIEKNQIRFPKTLQAMKQNGSKPLYFHSKSEAEESTWICEQIQNLHAKGVPLSDMAILYRAHYLTRSLEEALLEKSIPYKIFSGIEFYGRKEIKDVICYLRMVTSNDDVAFLRTVNMPSRKIGRKKLEVLKEYAEKQSVSLYQALKENLDSDLMKGTRALRYITAIEHIKHHRSNMSLGDAVQTLLDMSGYEEYLRLQGDQERLDNVAELKRSIENFGQDNDATIEDFLSRIALFTNLDHEEKKDTVKLMTVHTSKGMEFLHVFICGLNEGVFPSRKINTPEEMDEERRLAYVAMTRAIENLYLSDSEGLSNDGIFKYPSRFIFNIGDHNLEYVKEIDQSLKETALRYIELDEQKLLLRQIHFAQGDKVAHPVFGSGVIISVNQREMSYTISFDSLKTQRTLQFGSNITKID